MYNRTRTEINRHDVDAHRQRVTQTNMVYLIGLPSSLANDKLLRQDDYCGQYGRITKVLIKQNQINDFASFSAYVTYEQEYSAALAIIGVNNLTMDKHRIYASYGTNKYCSTFVKFGKCKKDDCPFLHRIDKSLEIREQDNKKLFQEQQDLARKYLAQHYKQLDTSVTNMTSIFPSVSQIIHELIQEGTIVSEQVVNSDQAFNSPRNLKDTLSTEESSPYKQAEESNQYKIRKRLQRRVESKRSRLFGFVRQIREYEAITKQLQQYLLVV